jgi:hypothetical protein
MGGFALVLFSIAAANFNVLQSLIFLNRHYHHHWPTMLGDQHRFGASQIDQTPEAVLCVLRRHASHGLALAFLQTTYGHFSLFIKVTLDGPTGPRLIAQLGMVLHRPLQRRAGWQALDFIGKPGLEGAIVGENRRSDYGRPTVSRPKTVKDAPQNGSISAQRTLTHYRF